MTTFPFVPVSRWNTFVGQIATANIESICSQEPSTYYHAIHPTMWTASTIYALGATTRSPVDNNMVYECTVTGTSGASEPPWAIVQDETFTDGTVTWKAHNNYSIVTATLESTDKVIADSPNGGRQLTIATKNGNISHREGTVTHLALLNSTDKTIEYLTTATTTVVADNDILSGRTVIFNTFTIIAQPKVV